VRRAFLCGLDDKTGKSYEHRRDWIEDRVRVLSSLFSIELCAYAVMSNHYHLGVKLNPGGVNAWTNDEVLNRWTSLFKGPILVQRYRAGDELDETEKQTVQSMASVYRQRLGSLSWFMKCLNEPIARKANAEDGCTGHFWEARFRSDPLCSERALLTAMAYIDLNPVRAKIAKTPEQSAYTSIRARIEGDYVRKTLHGAVSRLLGRKELNHFESAVRPLMPFADEQPSENSAAATLPIERQAYLELVDVAGRLVRMGKRGRIDPALAPILDRLGLSEDQWASASSDFRQYYRKGDLRFDRVA
jgi:REP element-mobilizing transposase RayT